MQLAAFCEDPEVLVEILPGRDFTGGIQMTA